MFEAQNGARIQAGLPALTLDPLLTSIARQRANDMLARGYFSHTSPSGETAFTLLAAAGRRGVLAGENIARNNYPSTQSAGVALDGFLSSPSHRQNLMETRFRFVGIGAVQGPDGMKYFVVIFTS